MAFDLKSFKKTLVYKASGRISELQQDLEVLRRLDTAMERREAGWGITAGLAIIATIVALGISAHADFRAASLVPVIVGGCVSLCAIILMATAAHLNIENRRYNLVTQILELLGADVGPESAVTVRLDLRSPTHDSKHDSAGRVAQWAVEYYQDAWLEIRGRFLDGTAWRVAAAELTQVRTRTKYSASGKRKTKTKTKSQTQFVVHLKTKAKRYARLTTLGEQAKAAIKLPDFAQLKKVGVKDGVASLCSATKASWDATAPGQAWEGYYRPASRIIAMMFLSLYQILNLSRRMTKRMRKLGKETL